MHTTTFSSLTILKNASEEGPTEEDKSPKTTLPSSASILLDFSSSSSSSSSTSHNSTTTGDSSSRSNGSSLSSSRISDLNDSGKGALITKSASNGFAGAEPPTPGNLARGGAGVRESSEETECKRLYDELKNICDANELYNRLIAVPEGNIPVIQHLSKEFAGVIFSKLKPAQRISLITSWPNLIKNGYIKNCIVGMLMHLSPDLDGALVNMLALPDPEGNATILHHDGIFAASLTLLNRCTKEQAKRLLEHPHNSKVIKSVLITPNLIPILVISKEGQKLLNHLMDLTQEDQEPMLALLECLKELVTWGGKYGYFESHPKSKNDLVKLLTDKRGDTSYIEKWAERKELESACKLVREAELAAGGGSGSLTTTTTIGLGGNTDPLPLTSAATIPQEETPSTLLPLPAPQ